MYKVEQIEAYLEANGIEFVSVEDYGFEFMNCEGDFYITYDSGADTDELDTIELTEEEAYEEIGYPDAWENNY